MDEVNFGYHGHENYKDKGIFKVFRKEKNYEKKKPKFNSKHKT
jgi:hypothetical protein